MKFFTRISGIDITRKNKHTNKKSTRKKDLSKAVGRNREIPYLFTGAVLVVLLFIFLSVRTCKEHTQDITTSEKQHILQQKAPVSAETASAETASAKESPMPKTISARLELESIDNIDVLKVIPLESRDKNSAIKYTYKWTKNGKPFGENTDSVSGFKKGDKIEAMITPFDGDNYGQTMILSTVIMKTTPKIIENREISFDGNMLSHTVMAVDPDGGKLSYSLIEAPGGMTIDKTDGKINWPVEPDEFGQFIVKVRVSNDQGGEAVYQLKINLDKAKDRSEKEAAISP